MSFCRYAVILLIALLGLTACEPYSDEFEIDAHSGLKVASYGSWPSPINASDVYDLADEFGELQSIDDALYFVQSDAQFGGGYGIYRLSEAGITNVVDAQFNVQSTVHEHGGSPFVGIGNTLFASKADDQRLYRIAPNQPPFPLTPLGTRHADCVGVDKGTQLICIREDHRDPNDVIATIEAINLNFADEGTTLVSGGDFYSSLRISPNGKKLVWLSWQQPNMPWDNTTLWMADVDAKGGINNIRQLAKQHQGAISQPMFSPQNELYFVADFDNWWNIYHLSDNGELKQILDMDAEFAVPDWQFGNHNYAFESANAIIASYVTQGRAELIRIFLDTGITESIAVDFGEISQVVSAGGQVMFVGHKVTPEQGIYRVNGPGIELIYTPELPMLDPRFVSRAQHVDFRTGEGSQAYGYFYPPVNPNFVAPNDTRPPLLVLLHDGPTKRASLRFRRDIQFWTSRGFAVMDLNYRGSSGFGRAYRESLYGQWGIADVEDTVRVAGHLVNKGWVDGTQLAIRGSGAGGYTVLSALAFYNTFKAGVAYSAISDLEALSQRTTKFEKGYLAQLIGHDIKTAEAYRERSPMSHLSQVQEPLLQIQGSNDPLAPAVRADAIYQSLKQRGVPTALITYQNEGHGLKQPKHKVEALRAELSFYGQVFGFKPAGKGIELKIDNLDN
ncbi:S9 family peptidase [Shewanella waksmanii]|uniref:S9 family peptidase n=1 Tax=Shewanella waksmanii TaxID=213783 RepID=UPI00048E64B2|nr:prolyl oligopeptidase family serine peptidase [Shewanella waksmanii]